MGAVRGFFSPVLLDLSGRGISIDPLTSSHKFLDLDGDGYERRTAWASAGTGVLVIDADGDGRISRSKEFAFTEWDPSADSDLEALRRVFDTNHDNKLDSRDTRWGEFRIELDGQLLELDAPGVNIRSIDLIAAGSGQRFEDGSAITGTAQFTRADGTTGTVADAVLANEGDGHVVTTSEPVTNANGSKTVTISGTDKEVDRPGFSGGCLV